MTVPTLVVTCSRAKPLTGTHPDNDRALDLTRVGKYVTKMSTLRLRLNFLGSASIRQTKLLLVSQDFRNRHFVGRECFQIIGRRFPRFSPICRGILKSLFKLDWPLVWNFVGMLFEKALPHVSHIFFLRGRKIGLSIFSRKTCVCTISKNN